MRNFTFYFYRVIKVVRRQKIKRHQDNFPCNMYFEKNCYNYSFTFTTL